MRRYELSNVEWAAIEPLLPPEKAWTGRPGKSHRLILNGIFWLARSGSPWRELPERYGPWRTVATRFYRWARSGLFDRILQRLQGLAEARGEIDWGAQFVDSTIVRAHQVAAGAKGGSKQSVWVVRAALGVSSKRLPPVLAQQAREAASALNSTSSATATADHLHSPSRPAKRTTRPSSKRFSMPVQ
jgi:transposase